MNQVLKDVAQSMEEDFESQSSKVDSVSTSGLSSIAEIARKVVEKEAQLARLEDEAKETKKALYN